MPIRSGDVIDGKYCLERTLGIGGMGIVYEAHHIELQVRRAIKIMQPPPGNHTGADNVDPNAQVRFLREARAAARIVSEHVAHVYDVGVLESGERYMVIEYLSGTDLERLVRKRGPLSAAKAVAYVLQACSGISEAHKLGIIHRDIKSSNLFLTETGVIKVIDWGLAKQTLNGETAITQANHVVGSLEYMSPEQLNGDEVDARTDIWSLGVVLHELVTGKLPFTGGTYGEIIHNILRKEPTATTWMSEVSLALDAIVRRCLQKDRNLRYGSVDALARDLRAVVIPQPSMRDTIELSAGGMPPQASLPDTSTAKRRSSKHEQETALHHHRRDRTTGSFRPKARKSKTSTEAKPPERSHRTPGSRTALYALSVMALFVLLIYANSEQPSLVHGMASAATEPGPATEGGKAMHEVRESAKDSVQSAAVATSEASRTNDGNNAMPEVRELARRSEPASPEPPRREPQPQPAERRPKPSSPLAAVHQRNAPTGDVRGATRSSTAEHDASHAPVGQPGSAAPLPQAPSPIDSGQKDPGTGDVSAPWPDVSSNRGFPHTR